MHSLQLLLHWDCSLDGRSDHFFLCAFFISSLSSHLLWKQTITSASNWPYLTRLITINDNRGSNDMTDESALSKLKKVHKVRGMTVFTRMYTVKSSHIVRCSWSEQLLQWTIPTGARGQANNVELHKRTVMELEDSFCLFIGWVVGSLWLHLGLRF